MDFQDWRIGIQALIRYLQPTVKDNPVLIILQQVHDQIQGLQIVFPLKMLP
jgi:hypothetical protein